MLPWIRPGDTLQCLPMQGKRPRWGRVYVFRDGGGWVAHRLLWPWGAQFFKGDNAPFAARATSPLWWEVVAVMRGQARHHWTVRVPGCWALGLLSWARALLWQLRR